MTPVKRVDLSKLSPDQRAAFVKFYRDCRSFAGTRDEIAQTAHAVFQEFVKAPRWGISEGPTPGDQPQKLWHVGSPEVNYVDHIGEA
jgi:hypothetical protein